MKQTVSTETDDIDESTQTESIVANTHHKMSDHEIKNSSSNSVTPGQVARQIKAVTNLLPRHLERLCELMRELKHEPSERRQEETTSFQSH